MTTAAPATHAETARLPWLLGVLVNIMRRLVTSKPRVSAVEKVLRGALLVPFFGMFLLSARWRAALRRPLVMTAETSDGFIVRCTPPDLVQMYIALFGVWEPDVAAFLRRSLEPGDVCIDVGANVGYDALLAAMKVGERGAVVAIEASPRIWRELRANLDLNAASHVRAVNKAASDAAGMLTIFVGPEHNLGLTTTVAQRGFRQEAEVEARPLHELLAEDEMRRARLVKIDVEGGEPAVLRGMHEFIRHAPPHVEIMIELSPLWWADQSLRGSELLQPFFDAGFHVYEIPNNYWPWRYLWPNDVQRPRRFHGSLDRKVKRIDVVLSRRNEDVL